MSLLLLFGGVASQTLTATGVNDATDGFGSPQLNLSLAATAVDDSSDAFGSPTVSLSLTATGVVNTTSFGTHSIAENAQIQAAFFAVF